ncbi:otoferlin-like [Onthophagus taurus]|uniref:otoferlin-like n=1 Tax=Onthophagus taurus TaxID=166361 RepID=UPI0039BE25C7
MTAKKEFFLINVTVLEGRHFAWPSMDSYVRIKIGNFSQKTGVRKSTDCPFFNEYFVFEFRTDLQTLLDKQILITVIKPGKCWCRKKSLGFCRLDVATVWNQPDHIFYQKWAILTSKSPKHTGPRGYLKITFTVLTKDSQAKVPLANPNINDEIEGNLLLPDGLTLQRQRAIFIFKIYRGEDILKKKTILDNCRNKTKVGMPSTLIEISFAGITVGIQCFHHHFYSKVLILANQNCLCRIRLKLGS